MSFDYSILHAKSIILPVYKQVEFYLVGCGGTGSWLAPSLCRIARTLNEQGKATTLIFIDPDAVERKNVLRQNFCNAEIGLNKAQTLALRYSLSWGVEINALPALFDSQIVARDYYQREHKVKIIIGCVDNAIARQSITRALSQYQSWHTRDVATELWWLDCGNHSNSGQVLIGSHLSMEIDVYKFHELGCTKLPAPCLQHPELLKPKPEESGNSSISCAELALLNAQSLSINQRMAAEAASYLVQLGTGKLNRLATYLDLNSGFATSTFITEDVIAKIVTDAKDLAKT
ncbi:ThiF family adenylyltransferase [Pleurocapsales cyanobacterium LEGE 10410]|nr:ThiF family adenylyltransferase [Pleurocapsales cyanobacterium LEGE 10410]